MKVVIYNFMEKETFVYKLARVLSWMLYRGLYRVKLTGLENIPENGAFILATNHASFLDPSLVGYALTRPIYYFARKTLFRFWIGAWFLARLNTIPVDREGPSDIAAFKQVLSILGQGHGMLIFPEGTRSRDGKLQEAKSGIGLLACRSQAIVVPTRIFGSYEALSRHHKLPRIKGRLHVVYDKPMLPSEYDPQGPSKVRYAEASNRIMNRIRDLRIP